ncbi:MAG TPA: NADH-quinone oxidoreductase subunit L, partial [Anaerolineae bacterium]|nr:NADH-quinone oxidoreductase subunit L [Anaerolineae bacterium]
IMVPFVCLMIFIYSVGYMGLGTPYVDPRYSRFFAYIALFATGMLGLVVADNLVLLFIFWEIMGLCSYLLIGFWFDKSYPDPKRITPKEAGLKAFLTTRIGDVLMFSGMALLFAQTGTLTFDVIFRSDILEQLAHTTVNVSLFGSTPWATVIAVLIFWGAIGKSAQFPLHVWLPDAMEGPTPVSALIHAATMVSAGVYLIIRTFPLMQVVEHGPALSFIAFIGAFTALFAATIGIAQDDIKRVLAYSTVSQLGYMFAALGIGAYVAAAFHLLAHSFFKALLFLGSGSVIHGVEHGYHATHSAHREHEEPHEFFDANDMMNMGGLWQRMPRTALTFTAGALALTGIIPFAGFWSKDEILAEAAHGGRVWVFSMLAFAAFVTAFYTGRQVFLTFAGEPRTEAAAHAHESPGSMTWPLIILAIFATFGGFVGIPADFPVLGPLLGHNPFHHFLGSLAEALRIEVETFPINWNALLGSLTVAGLGWLLAWLIYGREPLKAGQPDPLSKALGPVWTVLRNKYYIDELYMATVVAFAKWLANFLFRFDDSWVIDPIVDFVGRLGRKVSDALRAFFDEPVVDGVVNGVGWVTTQTSGLLRLVQTGRAQNYLLVAVATLMLLLGLFLSFGVPQ